MNVFSQSIIIQNKRCFEVVKGNESIQHSRKGSTAERLEFVFHEQLEIGSYIHTCNWSVANRKYDVFFEKSWRVDKDSVVDYNERINQVKHFVVSIDSDHGNKSS